MLTLMLLLVACSSSPEPVAETGTASSPGVGSVRNCDAALVSISPDPLGGAGGVESDGYPRIRPSNGVCPPGTVGDPTSIATYSGIFLSCNYLCEPSCQTREVCAPKAEGNSCECHPAFTSLPDGCQWDTLLDNGNFDGCTGWTLIEQNSRPDAAHADIASSSLSLRTESLCAFASAQAVVRLPPEDEFPAGAAVVFDYQSNVETGLLDFAFRPVQPIRLGFDDTLTEAVLEPVAEWAEARVCVDLPHQTELSTLTITVGASGECARITGWQVLLDNLRLEADADCG